MFYRWTRDLHLYFGLFISPFILLFAVSVFVLNHAKIETGRWTSTETFANLQVPDGLDLVRGPDAVARAKVILRQVNADGEIGFTRFVKDTRNFVFPVSKPGMEIMVDVDLDAGSASVSRRPTSVWEAFAYLHKMPGPHNVNIRGNWIWTQVWRWFADGTVYLLMFLTFSGIYLWWVLKAERRTGLAFLTLGAMTLFGLVYAVIR